MIPTKTSVIQHKWTAALTLKKSLGPGWIRLSHFTFNPPEPRQKYYGFFFQFQYIRERLSFRRAWLDEITWNQKKQLRSIFLRKIFLCESFLSERFHRMGCSLSFIPNDRHSFTPLNGCPGCQRFCFFFSFLSRSGESAKTWYADSRDASPLTDGGRQR